MNCKRVVKESIMTSEYTLSMPPDGMEAIIERLKYSISEKDLCHKVYYSKCKARPLMESIRFVMGVLENCSREDIAEVVIRLITERSKEESVVEDLEDEIADLKHKLDNIKWEAEY